MASYIPLPYPTAQPDAPAAPVSRLRAPTVNLDGLKGAVSQLSQAGKQSYIPLEPFLAPGRGLEAIGAGLQRASDPLAKLAIAKLEVINDNKLSDIQDTLAVTALEFEKRKEEIAPDRWEAEWQTKAQGALDAILGDSTLSPMARQRAEIYAKHWMRRTTIDLGHSSIVELGQRAEHKLFANIDRSILTDDFDGADAGLNAIEADVNAGRKTYVDPRMLIRKRAEVKDARARAAVEAENAHERTAIETAVGMANDDPDGAAKMVNAPDFGKAEGLKPTTVKLIRNQVQAAQGDSFRATQGAVLDAIVSGKDADGKPVATPEDVARVAGNRLRPHELKKLQDTLMDFHTEARKAEMAKPESQRALFGELLDRAWKFDREALGGVNSKTARDEYSDILTLTAWLDPVRRGEVTKPLAAKWFAAAPKIDGTVKEYLTQSVKDLFEAGSFGQTEVKVPKVAGDEGFVTGETRYKTVKDQAGLAAARAKMADAMIALNDWAEKNPKATREDATAAIRSFGGQGMREEDSDAIIEGARQKTTAPIPLDSIRQRLQPAAGAQGDAGAAGAVGDGLVSMVKDAEGFFPKAYGDYKQHSVGYGTRATSPDESLTEQEADGRLRKELAMHAGNVDAAAKKGGYSLTEKQRDALISFDFNTGSATHLLGTAGGSLREIERRMRLYVNAGGEELPGLVKRRKREADLFGNDITE